MRVKTQNLRRAAYTVYRLTALVAWSHVFSRMSNYLNESKTNFIVSFTGSQTSRFHFPATNNGMDLVPLSTPYGTEWLRQANFKSAGVSSGLRYARFNYGKEWDLITYSFEKQIQHNLEIDSSLEGVKVVIV